MERFKQKTTEYHIILCGHCVLEDGWRRALQEAGVFKPDVTRLPAGIGSLASIQEEIFAQAILLAAAKYLAMHEVAAICFFNHQQCGAYSHEGHRFPTDRLSEEEREFHIHELETAEKRLREFLDERGFQHVRLHGGFIWVDSADKLHITWRNAPQDNRQLTLAG